MHADFCTGLVLGTTFSALGALLGLVFVEKANRSHRKEEARAKAKKAKLDREEAMLQVWFRLGTGPASAGWHYCSAIRCGPNLLEAVFTSTLIY